MVSSALGGLDNFLRNIMAANKIISFGPVALSNVVANIITPPTVTGGTGLTGTNTSTYLIIRQITIVNKTASTATFSLYKGASGGSAAGTEIVGSATQVLANSSYVYYCSMRVDVGEFISGLASASAALTFQATGEIGVA